MRQSWQEQTGRHYVITEATVAGSSPSPTMRMRQLGMALRRLRDDAGKNQKEAAQWIDVTDTALSKMERGVRRVRVAYVRSLCQLYGVGSPQVEFLERLARESNVRGWWAAYGDTVPDWFADFLGMETVAAEVWTYESEHVPGLLQTPEYVEAVANARSSDPERYARLRATRQERLFDNEEPLTLRAVLNEAVLSRPVGGRDVLRGQLQHIIEMQKLPNVTVQVLPFSVGLHPAMAGSFAALRFPETPMNTVYIDVQGGAVWVEKPPDVERYAATFEHLTRVALTPADTVSLLEQLTRRYSE